MTRSESRRVGPALRGFTLIELLVVIAIIALLLSILTPSLSKAKDIAKKVSCASNVRSIGLAVTQYQVEFDGWLPMCYQGCDTRVSRAYVIGATYCWEISRFLGCEDDPWFEGGFWESGAPPALTCPSERKDWGAHILGYGWNWASLGAYIRPSGDWWKRRKVREVARPGETSCLGETRPMDNTLYGELPTQLTIFWGYQGSAPDYYCGKRHDDGTNFLCVDGHIEHWKYDDLIDDWDNRARTLDRGE